MAKEVAIIEAEPDHPAGRGFDDLSAREKKFVEFWFQFVAEVDEGGENYTPGQVATMAAEAAGWTKGGDARKAGWRLIRSPKIRQLLHRMAGIETTMEAYRSMRTIVEIRDNITFPAGTRLKAAQDLADRNEDLKKVQEIKMTHEREMTEEELDAELRAALERQGVKVIDGGKLVHHDTIDGTAVEVRPVPGYPGRFEANPQPEASRLDLHSARGPARIVKAQDPRLPRRGRHLKVPAVPNKEAEEIRRQLRELGITPEEAGLE